MQLPVSETMPVPAGNILMCGASSGTRLLYALLGWAPDPVEKARMKHGKNNASNGRKKGSAKRGKTNFQKTMGMLWQSPFLGEHGMVSHSSLLLVLD